MRVDCVYMLLTLLLPLLPAFVLFRFLPSSSDVQGPFKGLTVKTRRCLRGLLSDCSLVMASRRFPLGPNLVGQLERCRSHHI